MRRITLWVLSTLSTLVLLFGYHTSTSGTQATNAPTSVYSSDAGSSGSAVAPESGAESGADSGADSGSDSGADSGAGADTGSSGTTPGSSSGTRTITGSVAQTQWGPVQVQLKVGDEKITHVSVIQYPDGNGRDQQINSQALPILIQETIDAQGAQIDMVSGATVTSNGYLESLQSALDQAGL